MRSDAQYWKSPEAIRKLMIGTFLAPIAAAVGFQANYMLVPFACQSGWTLVLHAAPLVAFALAGSGFLMAWRAWQLSGAHWPDEEGTAARRSRFAAVFGMILSGTSVLLIVMQWIPIFLLSPCVE